MKICNILGVNVAVTNMKDTLDYIERNLQDLKGNYICVSNVHTTIMAYENKEYMKIQNEGVMVLPDGGPLSAVSRKRGFSTAERVTGPDLMGEIFKLSEEKGYTHYFYGSTEETLKIMEQNIKDKFPKINIVGLYSPPFNKEINIESYDRILEINNLKPDFVWVGLGAPKQEKWMSLHKNRINSLMIGVGAGFDYYADKIKRAPNWMQKNNLEWLYRLIQDPKRLLKRYLTTNAKFIKNAIVLKR